MCGRDPEWNKKSQRKFYATASLRANARLRLNGPVLYKESAGNDPIENFAKAALLHKDVFQRKPALPVVQRRSRQ